MSSDFSAQTEAHFNHISDFILNELSAGEELNLSLDGEESSFFRFNNAQVRQNTFVQQNLLSLTFQRERRKVSFDIMLTGNKDQDQNHLLTLLDRARQEAKVLPEDPYLTGLENQGESHKIYPGRHLSSQETIEAIIDGTSGSDFVGLYAGGPVIRASRNSRGQKHWFSTENFFIDYSLFTKNQDGDNKAVKGIYAGLEWDQSQFQNRLQTSKNQLSLMRKKTQKIPRGQYRTYLAPAAVAEILGTMSWNAFSIRNLKQGNCGLAKMHEEGKFLSPLLSIHENFELGLCPQFNSLGEMAPQKLALIERGQGQNLLVSTRSSKEYGIAANGALSENLRSTEILPGKLLEADILKELGTGLYLGNLHYLNWSDVSNARITGMTRYAGFWVENGEVVGPIQDLRFDDSLYSLLGTNLEAITTHQELEPEVATYEQRSLGGKKVPGMLVREMSFTL